MAADRDNRRQELELAWRWQKVAPAAESEERERFLARQSARQLARGERAGGRRNDTGEWRQVLERLERIEHKLDRLWQRLAAEQQQQEPAFSRVWLNLGENGANLRLDAAEGEIRAGELWWCEFLIPGDSEPVELLARIAASRLRGRWREVELEFEYLSEFDRDRLGRALFQLERNRRGRKPADENNG